ncbi:unnamed protein product [Linum trigynum]
MGSALHLSLSSYERRSAFLPDGGTPSLARRAMLEPCPKAEGVNHSPEGGPLGGGKNSPEGASLGGGVFEPNPEVGWRESFPRGEDRSEAGRIPRREHRSVGGVFESNPEVGGVRVIPRGRTARRREAFPGGSIARRR